MGPHYRCLLRQWRLGSGTGSGSASYIAVLYTSSRRKLTPCRNLCAFFRSCGGLLQRWENVKVASLNGFLTRPNKHTPACLLGPFKCPAKRGPTLRLHGLLALLALEPARAHWYNRLAAPVRPLKDAARGEPVGSTDVRLCPGRRPPRRAARGREGQPAGKPYRIGYLGDVAAPN